MTTYRYYIPPQSKMPFVVAALSLLLCLNTIYLLVKMPSYTQYYDYWVTLAASGLQCLICLFLVRRRNEFLLVPAGIFAVLAAFDLTLLHWMEIALFVLLLFTMVLRMPAWARIVPCLLGTVAAGIGIWQVAMPVMDRIDRLVQTGRATSSYIVRYLIQTLTGNVLLLLSMLLLLYALRPQRRPGWMDDADGYDRIWE